MRLPKAKWIGIAVAVVAFGATATFALGRM